MFSPYNGIGKYLADLLRPLTFNEFSVRDSFDAAEKIRAIPKTFFDEGYRLISLDAISLFTNVPLNYTVNIILKRIYNNKIICTNLKKSTLKKLILDSCRKTIFSFNNILYKQLDGVAMGSVLGPVLANIVMTELENVIIRPLFNKNIIKFYIRYVDDTLLLVKPEFFEYVQNMFNSYHSNLKFTVDLFEDNTIHFLDLLILDDCSIDIFRKDTFTGNYIDFNSFIPWNYKISWVRSLIHRAREICSTNILFDKQVKLVDKFMAWNNFPFSIRKTLITKFLDVKPKEQSKTKEKHKVLWFNTPYLGKNGEFLLKKLKRKLKKYLNDKFEFRVIYKTNKISMFCSNKDPIDFLNKANVIYKFTCPSCLNSYIGKTERNLVTRLKEHANGEIDSAINIHLQKCRLFNDEISYLNILSDKKPDFCKIKLNTILSNTTIVDYNSNNWLHLAFLESYYIKYFSPTINTGSRAARDLKLF